VFQTEFDFELPIGYVDENGTMHRQGVMRRATAADEILPQRDPRVEKNPAYLTVIVLSRVVARLGTLTMVTPKVIEDLYTTDFAYLQDMYNRVNALEPERVVAECPSCGAEHAVEVEGLGGFAATPSTLSTRR